MLQVTLQVNGRTIGWIDIARRKDQVNPPPADAMLTYDYKITITRSGGYDVHDGTVSHRYGDGAWALVALVVDAAGLWPMWNRREQEMAEIRRRNQRTIDRNLEILNENAVLKAEVERLRKVVADEVDRFDRECDRGDAARAEVRRLTTAQQDKIRALIADSAFATITGQATEDVTPVVRVADVLRILGVEGNGA